MPLFNLRPANTGHQPPVRIDPVPEHAVSQSDPVMHPYRGFEDHGVPTTTVDHPITPESGTIQAHYSKPVHEPDPIPVRIVTEGGREYRAFNAYSEGVSGNAYPIVSRNVDRARVTIKNKSGVTVWLGNDTVRKDNGYPLDSGENVTWDVHTPIYAVTEDGTQQRIHIAVFYAVALDASRAVQPGT